MDQKAKDLQGNKIPASHIKINERLEKDGFKMIHDRRDGKSFAATGVKMDGREIYTQREGEKGFNRLINPITEKKNLEKLMKEGYNREDYLFCDALPGVKCPDCGAQGFRTDHPEIAVCGDYPGWFFYYIDEVDDESADTEVVIEGGELKTKPKKKAERKSY